MSITETKQSYLSDMDMAAMEALAESMGEPRYRGRQLFHWIHSRLETDLARMSDMPREMLFRLSREFAASTLENVAELSSADGMTRKGLLRLPDGQTAGVGADAGAGPGPRGRPVHRVCLQPGGVRPGLLVLCHGAGGLRAADAPGGDRGAGLLLREAAQGGVRAHGGGAGATSPTSSSWAWGSRWPTTSR